MVDLKDIKMKDLVRDIVLIFSDIDVNFFCDDKELKSRIHEVLISDDDSYEDEQTKIKEILIENEELIDKENFILCLLYNYNKYLNNPDRYEGIAEELKKLVGIIVYDPNIEITPEELHEYYTVIEKCEKVNEALEKVIKTHFKQQYKRIKQTAESKDLEGLIQEIYKHKREYIKNKGLSSEIQEEILENLNKIIASITDGNLKITKEKLPRYMDAIFNTKRRPEIIEAIIKEYCKEKENELASKMISMPKQALEDLKKIINSVLVNISLSRIAKENYEKLLMYMKGKDLKLFEYCYDDNKEKFKIEIRSSKKLMGDNKKTENNIRRLNMIKKSFDRENEFNGMEYILQAILLNDFEIILGNKQVGQIFKKVILENTAVKNGVPPTEIERMYRENKEEYNDKIESIKPDISIIADTVREYAGLLNIDRLLLISGMRLCYNLESLNKIDETTVKEVKRVLESILANIKDKNMKISCELEVKKKNLSYSELKLIEFSVEDLKRCIQKFTDTTYITEEQINEYKRKIEESEIVFSEMEYEIIDIVFSEEEQERYSTLSDINLLEIARKNNWDPEKIKQVLKQKSECSDNLLRELLEYNNLNEEDIMQLYLDGVIDKQALYATLEQVKISTAEFIDYYKQCFLENNTEEEQEKMEKHFHRYAALFKQEVNQEESQYQIDQDELMDEIIEKIGKKGRNKTIKDIAKDEDVVRTIALFHKKGLIDFQTIIEWLGNNNILEQFINHDAMSIDEIMQAIKQDVQGVSFQDINRAMVKYIYKDNLSYDERFKYIASGYVLEKDIVELYEKGFIKPEDLLELANKNIIDQRIADRALRKLEESSSVVITGLSDMKKVKFDINEIGGEPPTTGSKGNKQFIDPRIRQDFIGLFGAVPADTDIIDQENPFYNYEFYVIPEEDGYYGVNSIVIAERYFDEKYNPKEYATGNATYVMRYGDLQLLNQTDENKVSKRERVKCYRVIHNMGNKRKDGSWAREFMRAIVQVKLNSDLSEYKSYNEKRDKIINVLFDMYDVNTVNEIVELADEIDLYGLYDCEITSTGAIVGKQRFNEDQLDEPENDEL